MVDVSAGGGKICPPRVDLHVDTLSRLLARGGHFSGSRPDLQVDAPRARAGQVEILLMACFTQDDDVHPARAVAHMLRLAGELDADAKEPWRLVRSPDDLTALATDEIGMLPTIENARSLEGSVERLEEWWNRGVRIVSLTWNGANDLADGVSAAADRGLTSVGREVVRELERLGMALDVSHLGARALWEVLETEVPVLATHSNSRAIYDHPRNLTDGQLIALGDRGAVVGLNFYPPFLGSGAVDLVTVGDHAEHLAGLIGVGRVAVGTDLDGVDALPQGFRGHEDLPRFAAELDRRGFDAAARDGILGENFIHWWRRCTPPKR